MMHSRAYIEEMIVNRLLKDRPDDRSVSAYEFKLVASQLGPVMEKILWETSIPGFTDDDLVSFMLMKTHWMLKRNKYDFDRKPYGIFYIAFQRLMRDIVRMQESTKRRGMYLDALDTKADDDLQEEAPSGDQTGHGLFHSSLEYRLQVTDSFAFTDL